MAGEAVNQLYINNVKRFDISDTTAVASDVASGKKFYLANGQAATGTASGGKGFTLLNTTSLGSLSTTSTSASTTGKSLSVTNASDYDLLLVEVCVDSVVNNRHIATISMIYLTGTSNISTRNTTAVVSNKWNVRASSNGTKSSRQSTTAYGIYANSATLSSGTLTIPLYYRYNSNNTGTINNNYTARVYGFNLYSFLGG